MPTARQSTSRTAAPKGTGKANALSVPIYDPVVYTPTIKTRQPDGSYIVQAGKPVILNGDDEIGTSESARIMDCSRDYVGRLCDEGAFREGTDWRRIGTRGNYKLKRASVLKFAMLLRESPE